MRGLPSSGSDQTWALVPAPDDEHDSAAQAAALADQSAKLNELTEKLAVVTAKLDELSKRSKGHKSERRRRPKMPPPVPPKSDPEETEKKRREAIEIRNTKLETEIIPVPVPPDRCRCPTCGGDEKIRNVAEKLAALMAEEYLEERAKRGSRKRFDAVLAKVRSAPADDVD